MVASWIARNRSSIGISPVGTSMRASEKALLPESSVRVEIAIEARKRLDRAAPSRRGTPTRRRPRSGEERGVERAAELVARRPWSAGTAPAATSTRRSSERAVHSGDRAHLSYRRVGEMTPCIVRRPPTRRRGWLAGSASRSRTWLAMPIGSRSPPATNSRTASAGVDLGFGRRRLGVVDVHGGGSGASRSKSRYCSDSSTPRSPSVIVWCIF